jgi:hypothetical protein
MVTVRLTARGETRWKAFAKQAGEERAVTRRARPPDRRRRRGILAQPYASDVLLRSRTLELTGFSRSGAQKAAAALG